MDKELQAKLVSYFGSLDNALDKTMDFTTEQAPLVVQDIITWGIFSSLLGVGLCFLSMIGARILMKKVTEQVTDEDKSLIRFIYYVFLSIPIIISLYHLEIASKAFFAPRLYVLEQIKNFATN